MAKSENSGRQRGTLRKVLRYIRKYWVYLALSIIMAAITVTLTFYLPILTGRVIDLIIDKGLVDFDGVFAILRQMAVVIGITAVAQWIMNICNNKMTYRNVQDIRDEAFKRIEIMQLK